jgi:hypothetical protein
MSPSRSQFRCILILAVLALQPGLFKGALPEASPAGPDEEALSEIFERFASIEQGLVNLDRLEARLELKQADPLERSRALGGDPGAIVADVSENIVYLPYTGSLRAGAGTLASRSGNAIDQAVLLATMLNRSGFEARIVRGEIDKEDAITLLESTEQAPAGKPAFSAEDMRALRQELDAELPDLATRFSGPSPEEQRIEWREAITAREQALVSELGEAAPPEKTPLPVWMTQAARDYWWVQYREDPGGTWTHAHPAWPKEGPPPSLGGADEAYYGSLPQDSVQRITLRLEMDIQEADGDTKTVKLAELEDIPGSQLERNPVSLTIMPDTLAANPQARLEAAMRDARFVLVGVNGQVVHDPFTLSGVVLPPEALGSEAYGMADLFATVSDKGERAIAGLSGDEDTDVLAIRKMRLRIVSKAPGLPKREDIRVLYDAVEADGSVQRRKPGDIAAELTGSYLIGARTGRISETALARAMIGQARNIALLIEYDVFRDMVQPGRLPPVSEVVSEIDPSIPLMQLAFAESRMPMGTALARISGPLARLGLTSQTIGLDRPAIMLPERPLVRMMSTEGFVREDAETDARYRMRQVIDLVASPMIAVSPDMTSLRPRAAMRAGIWMSRLESGSTLAKTGTRSFDTASTMKAAADQGIPTVTLVPTGGGPSDTSTLPAAFAELDLPRDSLDAIRRDLERGFAVQTLKRLPDDMPYGAWWRIHPETGETLAMLDDGRGVNYQQYLNMLSVGLNVASGVMMAEGVQECMSDDFNKEGGSLACCLVTSALPMGPAGASMAGSIKAGHPAVMFAVAFLSVNSAVMSSIISDSMDLSGRCYE